LNRTPELAGIEVGQVTVIEVPPPGGGQDTADA
jgi:hypothetical protein